MLAHELDSLSVALSEYNHIHYGFAIYAKQTSTIRLITSEDDANSQTLWQTIEEGPFPIGSVCLKLDLSILPEVLQADFVKGVKTLRVPFCSSDVALLQCDSELSPFHDGTAITREERTLLLYRRGDATYQQLMNDMFDVVHGLQHLLGHHTCEGSDKLESYRHKDILDWISQVSQKDPLPPLPELDAHWGLSTGIGYGRVSRYFVPASLEDIVRYTPSPSSSSTTLPSPTPATVSLSQILPAPFTLPEPLTDGSNSDCIDHFEVVGPSQLLGTPPLSDVKTKWDRPLSQLASLPSSNPTNRKRKSRSSSSTHSAESLPHFPRNARAMKAMPRPRAREPTATSRSRKVDISIARKDSAFDDTAVAKNLSEEDEYDGDEYCGDDGDNDDDDDYCLARSPRPTKRAKTSTSKVTSRPRTHKKKSKSHKQQEGRISCINKCGATFGRLADANRHAAGCRLQQTVEKAICPRCSVLLSRRDAIRRHFLSAHNEIIALEDVPLVETVRE